MKIILPLELRKDMMNYDASFNTKSKSRTSLLSALTQPTLLIFAPEQTWLVTVRYPAWFLYVGKNPMTHFILEVDGFNILLF